MISPKWSLMGYDIKVWAGKNKDSLKTIASAICGLVAASFPDNKIVELAFGVGTGIITKWIMDGIEFYITPVKIS
jgi:hypothetical protein